VNIDPGSLLNALLQSGPFGFAIAYVIYRDNCDRKERKEQADTRNKIEEADIASREKLASSLTALSMVIQGRPHV
jgi:hypothetical protein